MDLFKYKKNKPRKKKGLSNGIITTTQAFDFYFLN